MTHRRLFVHIGAPKTGTTYIQGLLWENRNYFADLGLVLPGRRQRYHFAAGNDLLGIGVDWTEHRRRRTFDSFAAEVAASRADTVLFTDERLASAVPSAIGRIEQLSRDREIHIVYSTRHLGALLPSAWQEQVKHRSTVPYGQWLEKTVRRPGNKGEGAKFWKRHDVIGVLDRWSEAVADPGHVHVITVPKSGGGSDELWKRFARVLGIPDELPPTQVSRMNTALDYAQVEFLRRLNLEVAETMSRKVYIKTIRDLLAKRILAGQAHGSRAVLPAHLLPEVTVIADDVIEGLKSSNYDIVGDLDDLIPEVPATPTPMKPADADVVDAAVAGMAEFIQRTSQRSRSRGPESDWQRIKERVVDLSRDNAPVRGALNAYRAVRRRRPDDDDGHSGGLDLSDLEPEEVKPE